MGDEEEYGAFGGLFENFEEGVGGLLVHLLGEIDEHAAPASLHCGEQKRVDNPSGLSHGYDPLLAFDAEGGVKVAFAEPGVPRHEFAPLFDVFGREILAGDGEDEADIRVDEFADLVAFGALAAGVSVGAILTIKVLEEGEGKGDATAAIVLVEQDGVGNPAAVDHADKGLHQIFVFLYIRESHLSLPAI